MSAITIDGDLVHYEALGRGKPVILVHGWLGSWRYWVPAMRQLAGKYRTYALDLWGFGDSARDVNRYNFESQVALLAEFIEIMGIKKAALIGHDLGAAVVARYAAQHPDRVPRLMVIAPPLFWMTHTMQSLTQNIPAQKPAPAAAPDPVTPPANDDGKPAVFNKAETVPWRTEEMKARIRAALERQSHAPSTEDASKPAHEAAIPPTDQPVQEIDAAALPEPLDTLPKMPKVDYTPGETTLQMQTTNPLREFWSHDDRFKLLEAHVDDTPDRQKMHAELEKTDMMAFKSTVDSFTMVDTLTDLRKREMPLIVAYGENDTFMPLPDARMTEALESRTACAVRPMKERKHFPMLEDKAGFSRLLMGFLEATDVKQLDLPEIWARRVR